MALLFIYFWPKVLQTNNGIVSRLVFNQSHSAHKLDGHIVSIDDDESEGCLFVANSAVKSHSSTEPIETTNFNIRIDSNDKALDTCNRRRLRVCVSPLNGTSSEHPVVRMQIVTGFRVDNRLIKKVWLHWVSSRNHGFDRFPRIVWIWTLLESHIKLLRFLLFITKSIDSHLIRINCQKEKKIYSRLEPPLTDNRLNEYLLCMSLVSSDVTHYLS